MNVRIVELARHNIRSSTPAVRNDIALLKECEVYACVAAINITPLTGCRCWLRSRAINMSLLWSEEQEETIRFHLRHSPRCGFLIESFDRFQLAGVAPSLCLKNETKAVEQEICLHSLGVKCL